MDEVLSYYLPDYAQFMADFFTLCTQVLVAGVLFAFLIWAVTVAISTVYGWLVAWSGVRDEERG